MTCLKRSGRKERLGLLENYCLVTVPTLIWNGFTGIGRETSIVANLATLPHDPEEIERKAAFDPSIPYDWNIKHKQGRWSVLLPALVSAQRLITRLMVVLISGGFGYLGGRLAQSLALRGTSQIILGSRQPQVPPSWLPSARVVQTTWDSSAALERICGGVDAIVHAAGMNAQDCAADPIAALEFNGVATGRLLLAAARRGVRRFVYLSTAHVYGSPLAGEITEETCPAGLHPYATSHRAGEDLVRDAHERGEIGGVVLRLSNAFGAPAHQDANCWMLLVNDLCRQAVTQRKLTLESAGHQWRDFIKLHDVCNVIVHFVRLADIGEGLYNVGSGECIRIKDMARRITQRCHAILGYNPEIIKPDQRSGENPEPLTYCINRLLSTGFRLEGRIDEEIDDTLRFCQKHFV